MSFAAGLLLSVGAALGGELDVGVGASGTVLLADYFGVTPNPAPNLRSAYQAPVTPRMWLKAMAWWSPLSEPYVGPYGGEWGAVDFTATYRVPIGEGWLGPSFTVGDTISDGASVETAVRCLPGFEGDLPLPFALRFQWVTRPVGLALVYGWLPGDAGPRQEATEPHRGLQVQATLGPSTMVLNRPIGRTELGVRYTSPPYPFALSGNGAAFLGPDLRVHAGPVTVVAYGGLGAGVFEVPLRWYAELSLLVSFSSPAHAPATTP